MISPGDLPGASNSDRSRCGEVRLREDTAWREEMQARRRLLVTGLTLPLLMRYGYPLGFGST